MYPFWLVVIVYSMTVLIAIYTYQFQHFKQYWRDYLLTPIAMWVITSSPWSLNFTNIFFFLFTPRQEALGLKVYGNDPWILFKELFTPTFFLIITIIQLRFWHKDFLEFTRYDLTSQMERRRDSQSSSTYYGGGPSQSATTTTEQHPPPPKEEVKIEIDSSETQASTSKYTPSKSGESGKGSTPYQSVPTSHHSLSTVQRASGDELGEKASQENSQLTKKKRIPRLSIKFICGKLREIKKNVTPFTHFLHELFWRLLEIHLIRLVFLVSAIAAIHEV